MARGTVKKRLGCGLKNNRSHLTPADQRAITDVTAALLPALDFGQPDQAVVGDMILEMANRVGAVVEYERGERDEN